MGIIQRLIFGWLHVLLLFVQTRLFRYINSCCFVNAAKVIYSLLNNELSISFAAAVHKINTQLVLHPDISKLPEFRNAVITIGTFDGVHAGHRQILRQLKEEARRLNGETVIISFFPHPRKVVGKGDQLQLLNTQQEKIDLLTAEGIDHLVITPFTQDFAAQPAENYISDFLVGMFKPHTIIIGYDHKFGKNRLGDYKMLEDFAPRCNFIVKEISEKLLNEIAISSTRIRHALREGAVDTANELLGYSYFFSGTVVSGNKLGRTIGYPTANIEVENADKLIPGNGVYAVTVEIDNKTENGMMNIGVRPTIGESKRTIEVNLFNFDKDIYGASVKVNLQAFLRPEVKFNGLDALKNQLAIDKENSLKVLNA